MFLPKSIEVVTKYDVFWEKTISNDTTWCQSVKVSKCQSTSPICRFELLKYIYILNIIYRRFFAPEMSLTLWHLDTFDTFELFRILNINQLQGSPMYSKSNSTSFLVKKWSRWWSKNPTFRSSSHSFWSPIIHLRSRRFADSWLKFGENRCARCDFL